MSELNPFEKLSSEDIEKIKCFISDELSEKSQKLHDKKDGLQSRLYEIQEQIKEVEMEISKFWDVKWATQSILSKQIKLKENNS